MTAMQTAMASVIHQRVEIGWSLADHHLIEALVGAGFSANDVWINLDAAKAKARVFAQRRAA